MGYSVTQRNIIPACANLVTMVTDFTWGFMSDLTGNRPLWIIGPLVSTNHSNALDPSTSDTIFEYLSTNSIIQMCTTVVGSSILTAWPASDSTRVASFFLTACGYVTAVTWVSTGDDYSGKWNIMHY